MKLFDIGGSAFLLALSGCDWCDHPIEPDKCFASPFQPDIDPYVIESPVDLECGDPDFEPNEDLTQAVADDHVACAGKRVAHIRGVNDVDVYRTGECSASRFTNLPAPIVTSVNLRDADPNLRICVFPLCSDGPTSVQEGCDGDAKNASDTNLIYYSSHASGFVGCCRIGPGTLDVKFFCPERSRDVDTFFWVDGGEAPLGDSCSAYTFDYDVKVD